MTDSKGINHIIEIHTFAYFLSLMYAIIFDNFLCDMLSLIQLKLSFSLACYHITSFLNFLIKCKVSKISDLSATLSVCKKLDKRK